LDSDIVVSGGGHTWVFEMEALKILTPNGGDSLTPGETCRVRWCLYTPPRCDSVSLFLRTDTTWFLDTIATGLSPADSTFDWVVPPGPIDSCRVVAIAYGPGWQFDESDAPFRILPGGVAEAATVRVCDWALSVSPNPAPGRAVVRCDVPVASDVSLSLYDATGRKVEVLASGLRAPGRYSVHLGGLGHDPKSADGFRSCPAPGVYFVRLETRGVRIGSKVVLTK
jgi:hypothetical protein